MSTDWLGASVILALLGSYLAVWWFALTLLIVATGVGIEPASYLPHPTPGHPVPQWVERYRRLGLKP